MPARHHGIVFLFVSVGLLLAGCETTTTTAAPPPVDAAYVISAEEMDPSTMGEVRVTLTFKEIDSQSLNASPFGREKHLVRAGNRLCKIRVFRAKTRWAPSIGGVGLIQAKFVAGRSYRITGRYDSGFGTYAIIDTETGELVSDYVEVTFEVRTKPTGLPLILPIGS